MGGQEGRKKRQPDKVMTNCHSQTTGSRSLQTTVPHESAFYFELARSWLSQPSQVLISLLGNLPNRVSPGSAGLS